MCGLEINKNVPTTRTNQALSKIMQIMKKETQTLDIRKTALAPTTNPSRPKFTKITMIISR